MSYYTKITKAGLAAITTAMNSNAKVPIAYMAFGDGNGVVPEPNENSNSLVNEVYRTGINSVHEHEKNPNWLVCEAIIPSAVGGFNIREVALYDSTGGKMLAVASYPPTYKPTIEEGAAKIQTIRIIIQVDNTGVFELIIDPDVVLATLNDVNKNKIVPIASVNDLIEYRPLFNGQIVYLRSYHYGKATGWDYLTYDQNDSTEANYVTSFPAVEGGLWKRPTKDIIYAVDAGILPDNATDNTEAFTRLTKMLKVGDVVELPVGTCITGSFDINTLGVRFRGKQHAYSRILLKQEATIGVNEYNFFEKIRVQGPGINIAGSYLFTDKRNDNRADLDIHFYDCYFSEAEFVLKANGRGVLFEGNQFYNIRYSVAELNFPDENVFVPGGSDNQTFIESFRGFIFRKNRIHYSPCYFIYNIGPYAKNAKGFQFSENWIEGGGRFIVGYMKDALVNGNICYQRHTPYKCFELTGGENITITGNSISCHSTHPTYPRFGEFITSAGPLTGLVITGNTFNGMQKDLLRLSHNSSESKDISICNNIYINCFEESSSIFNITAGSIRRLTVNEKLNAPSSTWLPVRRSAGLSVYDHEIHVNATGTNLVHNFSRSQSLGSSPKQGIYTGTGIDEIQSISVGYEARMIEIWGDDGTRCYMPFGTELQQNGISINTDKLGFNATGNANKLNVIYSWKSE
ncbi:phage tail protein [Acinetobacter baumannii]|nr:phage tail protein [Acinetobacter baumannii]EHU2702765.1 phage tail protein [Acinetobacter baumannii]